MLGSPKAWLGIAYHAVMEAAGQHGGSDGIDAVIESAWQRAVDRAYEQARQHPLNKRWGRPETWPGYYMIAAMARVRGRELADASPRPVGSPASRSHSGQRRDAREQRLTAAGGKLVGQPDVIREDEIVDFKSGAVHEDGDPERARAAYVRQLHVYAYLVREATGSCPSKGVLIPMVGSPIEVQIESEVCDREAEHALGLLDEYNGLLANGASMDALADPSATTCRWCPYKCLCEPFWAAVAPDWGEELGAGAMKGVVDAPPTSTHAGTAIAVPIRVTAGTVPSASTQELSPLNPSIHSACDGLCEGDALRVTGLIRRPDDTMRASLQTVIVRDSALPPIEFRDQ